MANFTALFDACVLYPARPDITKEQIARTVALMNQAVPGRLVERYEELIDSLELPDPQDRHVLADAIKCQADVIVTNNLKDFRKDVLGRFGLEAQSPDIFLGHLFDRNPTSFCSAVRQLSCTGAAYKE